MKVSSTSVDIPYKHYHEEYMSNNNGTTATEVFLVVALVPPFALLNTILIFAIPNLINCYHLNIKYFLIEFCSIVFPAIAAVTVLPSYLGHVFVIVIVGNLLALYYVCVYSLFKSTQKLFTNAHGQSYHMKRRASVTYLRALTNIITAICILAVDFKIFPRRFSKTETFGFSVMDIGVGLYVTVNALVAPETRGIASHLTLRHTCMNSIPLFILGTARLLVTQMLNYQQHTSEYGLHWNFFFTLGFTKVFSSLLLSTLPSLKWNLFQLMSLTLIVCYEISLHLGLKDWILSDVTRTDFLSSNREGIFSLFGYLAIYFSGLSLGQLLFREKSFTIKKNLKVLATFLCTGCVGWTCTYYGEKYLGVSRRLANFGYYIWTITFVISMFCVALLGEIISHFLSISFKKKDKLPVVPLLFEACNCHGLLFFLLANLLTGLVNLSIKTLHTPPIQSFAIVTMYMLMCCGITCMYHVKKKCKNS